MSNIQTGAERMPHDLSHLGFLAGQIGRLITISTTPVIAGDSFEMDAVGALRLSPLRRGLAIDSTVDIFTFRSEERFSRNAETYLFPYTTLFRSMSNIQTGAERMPHDLSHLGFLAGQIGRLITISTTPVIAGDSFEMDAVGALRLSPLRRGLAIDSTVDIFTF